ncbi:putative phage abortive infection protein [Pedobacter suwonensis]|uniref:putative phage abortive infection protein n=1 Tax=Pedobacter suwonensis TaxID=332999 RepID=UPI0013562DBE|nr:putative phage abortive infection protein [Pedobacter suwonensis]
MIAKKYEIFNGIGELDMNATGQVGDFIGGIVGTLVATFSIILLYKTLTAQRESSNSQASEFAKSQNESRFFELLRIHRDNVSEIEFEYTEKIKNKNKIAKSRHFFVVAHKQLEFAFLEFDAYLNYHNLSSDDIYEDSYLNKIKGNKTIIKRNLNDYQLLAKIDICYLILFFGVGKNGKEEIFQILQGKYKTLFVNNILDFYRMKPSGSSKHYKTWKTLIQDNEFFNNYEAILQEREDCDNDEIPSNSLSYGHDNRTAYYPNNYVKYYGGHRFRLGHYYRHLYQLVCFLHYNTELSTDEKKNYTRIVRGQLSDYEQILFFYNSISQLGRVWELSDNKNEAINENDQLISRYNLVKNISKRPLVNNIQTQSFYP